MRLLMLLAGAIAGTAVIVAVAIAGGQVGKAPAVPVAPQHVTLQILSDSDRMVGPELVVRPGPVVLTIRNYARHAHTFSVPELGVERVVLPGSPTAPTTTVVRFTAPRGVFTWFCRLPCRNLMTGDVFAIDQPPMLRGSIWAEA